MKASTVLCICLLIVALVCIVSFAKADEATDAASAGNTGASANPADCPVQRTMNFMSSLMNRIRGSNPSASSSTATDSSASLRRRKRQVDAFGQPLNNQQLQPVVQPANLQPAMPTIQPTPQEVVAYDQNMQREEGRLRSMLNQLMGSQYMPSRDQVIQLLTTMLTLTLMMVLGPVLGSNANMVQTMVRQIVPFIVTAGVHYAADQAMPVKPIDAPITNVQLAPVQTAPPAYSQTF